MIGARTPIDQIGEAPRDVVLRPDASARAAIARRLGLVELRDLSCHFRLRRDQADRVMASGTLAAVVVQEDVATLEPFAAAVHEAFTLRFLPEAALSDTLDPDDPVDEIGVRSGIIDLEEAMCEQLALALDPYPRGLEAPPLSH